LSLLATLVRENEGQWKRRQDDYENKQQAYIYNHCYKMFIILSMICHFENAFKRMHINKTKAP